MKKPLISVVLPAYNCENTINVSIDSVLNQTFDEFELLIIENGSTDATSSVLQQIVDPRIKVYHLNEANIVAALNFGLEQANADLIARMDADDICLPNRLTSQFKFMNEHPDIGLVSGLVNYVGDDNKNEGYVHYVNWANSVKSPQQIYLSRFAESALPHPSILFRKELVNLYGGYLPHVPEDFELYNRWMDNGVLMGKVNEYVLDWHDGENRMSRNHGNYTPDKFAEVKAKYFTQWFRRKFRGDLPEIYIFGYSKVIKRRVEYLRTEGLEIRVFLDVKDSCSTQTMHFRDIEKIGNPFILSYVSDREGKKQIKVYLNSIGLQEGNQFYMMA